MHALCADYLKQPNSNADNGLMFCMPACVFPFFVLSVWDCHVRFVALQLQSQLSAFSVAAMVFCTVVHIDHC